MRLLVLGGTAFLGRHVTEAALARGDGVTHFNRGVTAPGLYPEVETLRGDRRLGLEPLRGREFDAVVDTSGYEPEAVRASAALLAGTAAHYAFVSSISAYRDLGKPGIDEDAPVATLSPEELRVATRETHYGALKALCEQAAEAAMPGLVLAVRPGLIVGSGDPTGRFTYWPRRIARGGEVLAPGRPGREVQVIDARDLAGWLLRSAEAGLTGTFNAVGPAVAMGSVLEECARTAGSEARLTWVDDEFLVEAGVEPWMELPLWIPETDRAFSGLLSVDGSRAVAAGLAFRPLAETVRDTLAEPEWERGQSLTAEREAQVLARWHRRVG